MNNLLQNYYKTPSPLERAGVRLLPLILLLCSLGTARAEIPGLDITFGGTLTSSYIWRGMRQASFSLQPTATLRYKRFSVNAWGNVELAKNGMKEVDFYLYYDLLDNLQLELNDCWNTSSGDPYFIYGKGTGHCWEAAVHYTLPFEKVPITLSWSTIFAGNDLLNGGRQAFSSYFLVSYPFNIKKVNLSVDLGLSPYNSNTYKCNSFAVNQIAANASYTIKACKEVSIPISTNLIFNPAENDVFFVLGVGVEIGNL